MNQLGIVIENVKGVVEARPSWEGSTKVLMEESQLEVEAPITLGTSSEGWELPGSERGNPTR